MKSDHPSAAFVPRNRLAKILTAMDRRAFLEHVANAEREVERIVPRLGDSIAGDVQTLIRLCRQDEIEVFVQCNDIGRLALKVVEGARLARRSELAEAAEGVWAMIEALAQKGVWHTDALKLHAEALQTLAAPEGVSSEQRKAIASALRELRDSVGA